MSLPQLSLSAARHLHLAAQGLLKKPRRRAQPADILSTVQRMSLLQIDTINIVARSPYLVLFSRLGNYPSQWLDEALSKGELMEYWAHEACFLPRSDFALVRHRMLAPEKMGWKYRQAWMLEHAAEIEQLIAHIQENGPVRSADFEHPRKGTSGWWEWKPHKRHLEGLFTSGKVMVIERRNFQRVYDLTHRVMPHWDDERDLLTQEAAEAIMLENSARSLGIFRPQWLADYYRLRQPALKPLLDIWQREQRIIPVTVESWAKCGCMRISSRYCLWPRRGNFRQPTVQCCRLSTRSSGTENAPSSCSILATGWNVIPQRQSASMVTLFSRCCIRGNWSGVWTPKCTARPARLKLLRFIWKRASG